MSDVLQRQAPSEHATDLPAPGRYRHFKGGEYEVLSVGRHSETDEWVVIYRSLEAPETVWVRPVEMFVEPVTRAGQTRARFELAAASHASPQRALEGVRRRLGEQLARLQKASALAKAITTDGRSLHR